MRDYTLYLKDILAAIESIEGFIAGMDLDSFQTDDKTTSAVMRKLEIMGEAVKHIPDEHAKLILKFYGEKWQARGTSSSTFTSA